MLSGGGSGGRGHHHQAEDAQLHGSELVHVAAVEHKQQLGQPGVFCPHARLSSTLWASSLPELYVHLVSEDGGQGEEVGVNDLLLQVYAAEVLETGRVELPVLALDPVEVAADEVELRVDTLHLVKDLLRLLGLDQ